MQKYVILPMTQPPHSSGFDLKEVMIEVEHDCSLLVEWFRDNY